MCLLICNQNKQYGVILHLNIFGRFSYKAIRQIQKKNWNETVFQQLLRTWNGANRKNLDEISTCTVVWQSQLNERWISDKKRRKVLSMDNLWCWLVLLQLCKINKKVVRMKILCQVRTVIYIFTFCGQFHLLTENYFRLHIWKK